MIVKLSDVLIWISWGLLTAYIVLQAQYQRLMAPLTIVEVSLIFLTSILAGIILADPEIIVFGFFGSLLTSITVMYICLSLPALIGQIRYAFLQATLLEGAIGIVARTVLVYLAVPCLVGSLLGGFIGERLMLRDKNLLRE